MHVVVIYLFSIFYHFKSDFIKVLGLSFFFLKTLLTVFQVYQRGIVTPMANIEQLWKDYLDFEKGINTIIAEKVMIIMDYCKNIAIFFFYQNIYNTDSECAQGTHSHSTSR